MRISWVSLSPACWWYCSSSSCVQNTRTWAQEKVRDSHLISSWDNPKQNGRVLKKHASVSGATHILDTSSSQDNYGELNVLCQWETLNKNQHSDDHPLLLFFPFPFCTWILMTTVQKNYPSNESMQIMPQYWREWRSPMPVVTRTTQAQSTHFAFFSVSSRAADNCAHKHTQKKKRERQNTLTLYKILSLLAKMIKRSAPEEPKICRPSLRSPWLLSPAVLLQDRAASHHSARCRKNEKEPTSK